MAGSSNLLDTLLICLSIHPLTHPSSLSLKMTTVIMTVINDAYYYVPNHPYMHSSNKSLLSI